MSAIDLDGHHRRRSGPAGRQFAAAVPSGLLVPLLDPFRTACGGDALHVCAALISTPARCRAKAASAKECSRAAAAVIRCRSVGL